MMQTSLLGKLIRFDGVRVSHNNRLLPPGDIEARVYAVQSTKSGELWLFVQPLWTSPIYRGTVLPLDDAPLIKVEASYCRVVAVEHCPHRMESYDCEQD